VDGQLASAHNLPALYTSPLLYPNKPVKTEPLSVTVPVIIDTGTVLVGTVSIHSLVFTTKPEKIIYLQFRISIYKKVINLLNLVFKEDGKLKKQYLPPQYRQI